MDFIMTRPPDQAPPNPVLPAHRVPAHLARRFQQICMGANDAVLAPHDLRPTEYSILAAVIDQPGLDQRRLATWIAMDPTTTGKMVDGLEARGLIERLIEPGDRRARILRATAKGQRLRRALRDDLLAAQQKVISVLSPAEQESFIDLLVRVVEGNDSYALYGNGRRKPKRPGKTEAAR